MKKYSKNIYQLEALLKAAFALTDSMYVHLDEEDNYYLVSLLSKEDEAEELLYLKFENELIAQQTRYIVSIKTKNLREMIVARALASTMINEENEEYNDCDDYKADEILKDWFSTDGE